MLELDSPRWAELHHAYGPASDIPSLLRELVQIPPSLGGHEPWNTLWSSLAHQGDVYSASFAAVPHVVAALASAPDRADSSYLHFPAWVEICRRRKAVPVPHDLQSAYFGAIHQLPSLVANLASRDWTDDMLVCALCAIAAAKGFPSVAEAVLELTPEAAKAFLETL